MGGDEEKFDQFMKTNQLVIDDEHGALGPHGTRALCTAIMGSAEGMSGAPCKLVKSVRIWRSDVNDDGAACLAELLRLGGAEVAISYLELLDNNVGFRGAKALGTSLSHGQNRSLLTLKLDYNATLGTDGCKALCQGLRTNETLKQLHLPYCAIDGAGGEPLGEMLSYPIAAPKSPRRLCIHVAAAASPRPRLLHGLSTSRPRRRRDSPPRKTSTEDLYGLSTSRPRRRRDSRLRGR